jgi:hypothetical protein
VPPKELSVFDAEHPRPKDELDAAKLRAVMTKRSDEQMAKLLPKDAESLKEFRRVVGTALKAMVNDAIITSTQNNSISSREYPQPAGWPEHLRRTKGVLSRAEETDGRKPPRPEPAEGQKEAVPYYWLENWKKDKNKDYVIWLHPQGKSSLFQGKNWAPAAKSLIDAGYHIIAIDAFQTGEQVREKGFPVDKNYAGYTYGYNPSVLAERVRDTILPIHIASGQAKFEGAKGKVHLLGFGEMGPVAILAKALAGDAVARVAADLNQFRFENIKDTADPMMLPGAVKYGGLPAFLALCAPGEVLVHNHKGTASGQLAKAAYDAAGAPDKLTREEAKLDDHKVVEWLVR